MDFGNAALLIAVVYGATELVKSILPGVVTDRPWAVALLTLAIAIGGTYLVAATVWSNTQVIGGHGLNEIGGWDRLLVGIMLGGAASFVNRGLGAVKNIGQNQPKDVGLVVEHPMPAPAPPPQG